jgi:quercetin dioxygenase-like cupin family protein
LLRGARDRRRNRLYHSQLEPERPAAFTPHEVDAITGHASLKEIVRYTATADRKRLAASAIASADSRGGSGNHRVRGEIEKTKTLIVREAQFMRCITLVALVAGSAAGIPIGFALSQASPQMRVDVLLEQVVSGVPQPAQLRVHDDRWDPGAETGVHDHPGPAILAVIEGELVEETPTGRNALRTGDAVWRAAKQSHNVRNVSGRPARVLAIHFDPVP